MPGGGPPPPAIPPSPHPAVYSFPKSVYPPRYETSGSPPAPARAHRPARHRAPGLAQHRPAAGAAARPVPLPPLPPLFPFPGARPVAPLPRRLVRPVLSPGPAPGAGRGRPRPGHGAGGPDPRDREPLRPLLPPRHHLREPHDGEKRRDPSRRAEHHPLLRHPDRPPPGGDGPPRAENGHPAGSLPDRGARPGVLGRRLSRDLPLPAAAGGGKRAAGKDRHPRAAAAPERAHHPQHPQRPGHHRPRGDDRHLQHRGLGTDGARRGRGPRDADREDCQRRILAAGALGRPPRQRPGAAARGVGRAAGRLPALPAASASPPSSGPTGG